MNVFFNSMSTVTENVMLRFSVFQIVFSQVLLIDTRYLRHKPVHRIPFQIFWSNV